MAYTNAQLVRLLVGDTGLAARDVTDGDGASVEFYLSTPPILADSQAVTIGTNPKTEGVDYTLDDVSGRMVFSAPVPQGEDNLVVVYRAVQISDSDVAEACRQEGLDPASTADTGEPLAAYKAAIMLALGMASLLATTDPAASAAWASRADALRARASTRAGSLVAGPTKREDGYSQDRTATDVLVTGANPRRRYYGEEDRIP